jgi:hypothetical protein
MGLRVFFLGKGKMELELEMRLIPNGFRVVRESGYPGLGRERRCLYCRRNENRRGWEWNVIKGG